MCGYLSSWLCVSAGQRMCVRTCVRVAVCGCFVCEQGIHTDTLSVHVPKNTCMCGFWPLQNLRAGYRCASGYFPGPGRVSVGMCVCAFVRVSVRVCECACGAFWVVWLFLPARVFVSGSCAPLACVASPMLVPPSLCFVFTCFTTTTTKFSLRPLPPPERR